MNKLNYYGLALMGALAMPAGRLYAAPEAPTISAASIVADDVVLVQGSGFEASPMYAHFDYAPWPMKVSSTNTGEALETELVRASLDRVLKGKPYITEPATNDPLWRVADTNREPNTFLAKRLERGLGLPTEENRLALLRVRTSHGVSAPFAVNRPEIWGVSPSSPRPGEVVTVWGVNLGDDFAIAGVDSHAVELAKSWRAYSDHSHRAEARFVRLVTMPDNLAPGAYTVYNLWGKTDAGWSLGKAMTVQGAATDARPLFKVREFGAEGDGQTDDTAAIRAAIAKARDAGNGMVFFEAGRYVISATLLVPDGVKLMGVSRDASVIEACRSKPFDISAAPLGESAPCLVALQVGGELEGLSLDLTRGARNMRGRAAYASIILVRGGNGPGPVIRDCRLRGETSAMYRDWLHLSVINGVLVWAPTRDMVFENNEVTVTGNALFNPAEPSIGHRIRFNVFRQPSPHSHNTSVALNDNREALVEGNIWENTGRGMCHEAQGGTTLRHNLYMHNIFRNLRKSDGEILLYECGSVVWSGQAEGVSNQCVFLAGNPVIKNVARSRMLFISEGRGIGQLREIVGTNGTAVVLERPFDVNPDETSKLVIMAGEVAENLHVGNEYFDSHQWVGIYGSGVRNVWVNETYERVTGGTYLWKIDGYRLMALNLIYRNKYHERAGIAVVSERSRGGETDKTQVFGNEIRKTSIESRAYVSTENGQNAPRLLDYQLDMTPNGKRREESNALELLPGRESGIGLFDKIAGKEAADPVCEALPVSTKWNLIYGNQIVRCPIGIEIGRAVGNTVIIGNLIVGADLPINDMGRGTRQDGNVIYRAQFKELSQGKEGK